MSTTTSTPSLTETVKALEDLLREGVRIGLDMFDLLARSQPSAAVGQALRSAAPLLQSAAPLLRRPGACSCHIPPPCWMPKALGDLVSHVCPGGTATIRIRVTNCSPTHRDIRIDVSPKDVTVTPQVLSLGPMERGTFTLSANVAADAGVGAEREFLVWVIGCLNHYLRWTVCAVKRGADCCHEVEVEDCTDNIHHWYDHFYCPRPCQTPVHR